MNFDLAPTAAPACCGCWVCWSVEEWWWRRRSSKQNNAQSEGVSLTAPSASAHRFHLNCHCNRCSDIHTDRRFNECWNEQLDRHAEERKAAEKAAAASTSTRDRSSSITAAAVPHLFSEDDCGLCSNELRDGRALNKSASHDQPHAPCSSLAQPPCQSLLWDDSSSTVAIAICLSGPQIHPLRVSDCFFQIEAQLREMAGWARPLVHHIRCCRCVCPRFRFSRLFHLDCMHQLVSLKCTQQQRSCRCHKEVTERISAARRRPGAAPLLTLLSV